MEDYIRVFGAGKWQQSNINLMKLGGSLGNVLQKNEKRVIKTRYISDC
jgi:hypothetical protein